MIDDFGNGNPAEVLNEYGNRAFFQEWLERGSWDGLTF